MFALLQKQDKDRMTLYCSNIVNIANDKTCVNVEVGIKDCLWVGWADQTKYTQMGKIGMNGFNLA